MENELLKLINESSDKTEAIKIAITIILCYQEQHESYLKPSAVPLQE